MRLEQYYIFRHNDGLDIQYLDDVFEWVDSLEQATTFGSESAAEHSLLEYAGMGIQYTHVIGKLVTAVDPLYVMKVIK